MKLFEFRGFSGGKPWNLDLPGTEKHRTRLELDVFELRSITFKDLMARELYDIEILFKLKQGQVEVAQAAVVTDYSDAIVIDQEVVECRNRRIADLGKDKVHILSKIKARNPKRARKILKTRPKGARNRGLKESFRSSFMHLSD